DLTQWQVVDGAAVERVWWAPVQPTLIFQVDDLPTASRVKLALLEEYPDEFEALIVRSAGDPEAETVTRLPLHQLDRSAAGEYDHLCTVYLPPLPADQRRPGFQELVDVVAMLRGPEGCPWDREQNYQSLKRFVLEEVYEVLEAVDSEDPARLCEELGDLALQVVMLAQFGKEDGYFDIRDVTGEIVTKLIRRHPHVFGSLSVEDSDEVLRNWDAIKQTEKPERTSVLDGVPKGLPALMKALEVSKRVVKVGFEWPTLAAVLEKLDEEVGELKAELPEGDREKLQGELGDLLFTAVNVARWLKIDPEEALRQMVERFGRRFREVERLAAAEERPLTGMDITELDRLWEQAKANLAAEAPSGS
ncbi:MAG TPA: nucleoside triphosphate pyrophosphohydrolase, partial [Armatimonadota bacterium]|nr:nucleoside triphosphate pyrophosphohydrolase [Armatimonadota bacterium]